MPCMATAPEDAGDDCFDQFLAQRGHEVERKRWERNYNKKQCPECGGLHESDATQCSVCGWTPAF